MKAKDELLEETTKIIAPKKALDLYFFLYILLSLFFVAVFAFPKIYLTQQIYYKSRNIQKLKVEYETLKAENKKINASVEEIKFKNQVLDTIF